MDQKPLRELVRIVRKLSYREGDFTLVSGKKSKFYIDLKATTLHPDGAYWIGEAALNLIQQENLSIHTVGGLTLGADPFSNGDFFGSASSRKDLACFYREKRIQSAWNFPVH